MMKEKLINYGSLRIGHHLLTSFATISLNISNLLMRILFFLWMARLILRHFARGRIRIAIAAKIISRSIVMQNTVNFVVWDSMGNADINRDSFPVVQIEIIEEIFVRYVIVNSILGS